MIADKATRRAFLGIAPMLASHAAKPRVQAVARNLDGSPCKRDADGWIRPSIVLYGRLSMKAAESLASKRLVEVGQL